MLPHILMLLNFASSAVEPPVSDWVDPTCTITTGITMASNTITTGITMASNSVTGDIGMGCGNQN